MFDEKKMRQVDRMRTKAKLDRLDLEAMAEGGAKRFFKTEGLRDVAMGKSTQRQNQGKMRGISNAERKALRLVEVARA